MKKIITRICIISAILYFVISSVYTIFYRELVKEDITIMQQTVEQGKENYLIEQDIRHNGIMQNQAILSILDTNFSLIGVSIGLGILITLIISFKEYSKVKYALYFILGFFFYSFISIVIIKFVMGEEVSQYFLYRVFKESILQILFSYMALYMILLIIHIGRNKSKVKQLNQTLKGEKESKRKLQIPYWKPIIISIIVIIIILFCGNIIRKTTILIQYSKAVETFKQSNNYYIEEISNGNVLSKYFYKDGTIVENAGGDNTVYYNQETQERITVNKNKKACVVKTNQMPEPVISFFYEGVHPRFWRTLLEALQLKITTEEIDGVSYYVFHERKDSKLYINQDTLLVERVISYITSTDFNTGEVKEKSTMTQYHYEFNTITDEEVAYPDLTGYEIYTDVKEFNEATRK